MKLIKYIGQPFCILLYIGSIVLTVKKKQAAGLIGLMLMHISEYFIIGRKVEQGIKGFFKCLAFGFTLWLPEKNK